MSSKLFKKGVLASSIAMVLAGGAAPFAMAEQNAADQETEVIEVRGLRGSLKANVNAKRFSDSVVDVISSEDIGKFPDKNVAESLARIPGVTIQRQFGEGSSVSIRGAGAEFTKTTLNGQNVASTGWFVLEPARRSFNYELLPSEIVGDLEVYKSSQANLIEGGVGGTVIVNTRTPLELDANTSYVSVEAMHSDDSGSTDPQLSGMYSWKNDAEDFGIMVSGVSQKRDLQRQGNEAFWEWGAGPVAFEQERKRQALTVALEWAPTENLSFVLNAMDMEMEANNTNYALWLTQGDTSWSGNTPEQCLGGDCSGDNRGTAVKGQLASGFYQARPREATMNSDLVDLKATYEADDFTLEVQVGDTNSSGGTDFEMVVDDGVNTPIVDGGYDFTNGNQTWSLPNGIGGQSMADYDPGSLAMGTGSTFNKTPKTDEESYFQVDLQLPLNGDFISSVELGARYGDHNTRSRQFYFDQREGFDPVISTSGLRTGTVDVGDGNYQISKFDVNALKEWAKASIVGQTEELGSYSEIDETNKAVYVMANYSGENYRGNFGVRYVKTDATSTYYTEGVKTSTDGGYSEVLPSFNLAYNLADDVILRVAAARTIARPQYNDMYVNPSAVGGNDDLDDNQFWIVGNVDLDPFMADQFEAGVEWYFNESSLLSATVFMKNVSNFISIESYHADSSTIDYDGLRPEEAAKGWTVQEKFNAKDGEVRGLELQYQQDFDNGFGLMANYTYTDATTGAETFGDGNGWLSDSSDHVFNASAFYENDDFSARISYNYRSEYMLREEGAYGNRLHDGFGTLDLSGVYHVNEMVDVKLDVVNLTGESSEQFGNNAMQTNASGFADGFPLYAYEMATRVIAGVSVKF
ncbi:TonB-dependent receptor [Thalassotalea sp. G2M2-11]|uniref:TonB-dependent receptor n=1 Tax=Thalassotalea sp. G2M2-11 TaxID=2787627 RepID=UPI0019D180ED|nr:TonB-dependent receptor [Thalassotalea sp. G2M2-11]